MENVPFDHARSRGSHGGWMETLISSRGVGNDLRDTLAWDAKIIA